MPPLPPAVAGLASQGANIAALAGGPAAAGIKIFTDALSKGAGAMGDFVGALSPATMEMFNTAVEEVMATIGQALLPVIEVFTSLLQRIGDVISPLMQELAPLFKILADIIGTVLLGAVNALVGIITAIGSLFGGLEDSMKGFRTAVQNFIRGMLSGLAYLIKAFAGADVVKKWAAAIGGVGTRAAVAPKNVAIQGLGDIASSMATAAFAATGKSEGEDEMLNLQRLIKADLERIADDGKTFRKWFEEEVLKPIIDWLKAIVDAVLGRGPRAFAGGAATAFGLGVQNIKAIIGLGAAAAGL